MKPLKSKKGLLPLSALANMERHPLRSEGLHLRNRTGIYVDSYQCWSCGVHFCIFSWVADKHPIAAVTCPECGTRGNFMHDQVCLSERTTFDVNGDREIFKLCPWPGIRTVELPPGVSSGAKINL